MSIANEIKPHGGEAGSQTADIGSVSRPRKNGRRPHRLRLFQAILVGADLIAVTAAFLVALGLSDGEARTTELLLFVALLPAWPILGRFHGLYRRDGERADHSTADDLVAVFHVVTAGTWLFVLTAWLTDIVDPAFGRMVTFWLLAIVLVAVLRAGGRSLAHRLRAGRQRALIVGAGTVGQLLGRKFLHHPEYGIDLVGFAEAQPAKLHAELADVPVVGSPARLGELVDRLGVERVVFAFTNEPDERTLDYIRGLKDHAVRIDVVPRLFEVLGPSVDIHSAEGIPLVALPSPGLSRPALLVKRSLDLFVSTVALVLLSPVLIAIAILIRLESPGPVVFRQLRMGADGIPFRILKYRTMVSDAEAHKDELRHLNKHDDPRLFKVPEDPRVTPLGRILRQFSLDELPQLINVLKGEMSLVGPRPLPLDEDRHVHDWARHRLAVKPGITGLWQVLGREEIPFGEMVKLDYLYVTEWSLLGDVKLLLRTVPAVLRRRDAC
jgi:exopolysaccharide biosynthesis polyprenyl glycosylphosphotransferase